MAVYTSLSQQDIQQLLLHYDIGQLVNFEEISSGIENTNYFVTTSLRDGENKRWVLTLFENLDSQELPYFTELTCHLAQAGFDVPAPLRMRQGESIFQLKNRSGVIVPCLIGQPMVQPDAQACGAIGEWMANMHLALQSFSVERPLVRDTGWISAQIGRLKPVMETEKFSVLHAYFERYKQYQPLLQKCAQGTVHGDLFRDNVLFNQGRISGVFDFYHACDTTLLFDVAVTANDWAFGMTGEAEGKYDSSKVESLTQAYQEVRPWSEIEQQAWPYCLELAALRFWLSRLVSSYLPGYQQHSLSGEPIKEPNEMRARLLSLADPHSSVVLN